MLFISDWQAFIPVQTIVNDYIIIKTRLVIVNNKEGRIVDVMPKQEDFTR